MECSEASMRQYMYPMSNVIRLYFGFSLLLSFFVAIMELYPINPEMGIKTYIARIVANVFLTGTLYQWKLELKHPSLLLSLNIVISLWILSYSFVHCKYEIFSYILQFMKHMQYLGIALIFEEISSIEKKTDTRHTIGTFCHRITTLMYIMLLWNMNILSFHPPQSSMLENFFATIQCCTIALSFFLRSKPNANC